MSPRILGALVVVLGVGIGTGVLLSSARAPSEPSTTPATTPAPEPADGDDDGTDTEGDIDEDDTRVEMQAKAKICKKLSCTESQKGELGAAIRQFREDSRERRIEIKNLRASAAALWRSAEPDPERVAELDGKRLQLESEVEALARGALLTFHRMLDEVQRRKLAKWLRRKSARDILQDARNREQGAE